MAEFPSLADAGADFVGSFPNSGQKCSIHSTNSSKRGTKLDSGWVCGATADDTGGASSVAEADGVADDTGGAT